MGKLLSWVVLSLLVWLAWRILVIVRRRSQAQRSRSLPEAPEVTEPVVRCDRCGVHVPRSEAIEEGGRHYCSESHRRAG